MNNKSSKNANKRKSDALGYEDDDSEPVASSSKQQKKIQDKPGRILSTKEAQLDLLERIDAVELDDERIFDNCQQVRRKINDFLATKQCTKTAFLVALGNELARSSLPPSLPISFSPVLYPPSSLLLTDSHAVPSALRRQFELPSTVLELQGTRSRSWQLRLLYPDAYYFFEKLRILNRKPKGAARKRAEDELPHGFKTETQTNRSYIVFGNASLWTDELGRVRSGPRGGY